MKITRSSDWRDALPFETPVLAADAVPGEPTRCVSCPAGSEPRERTELWVVKHRHPNNHAGFVRYYCAEHAPKTAPPTRVSDVATASDASAAKTMAASSRSAISEPTVLPSSNMASAACRYRAATFRSSS